ncbi:MAG: PAS domain S-box-containing protein [Alteromonadaceae bacterium]|jgi:PAS domain S-box-containing protein
MSELKVLIAEPSKTGRHIFSQLIARLGVEVTFTTSAKETYQQVAAQDYNLICLSQKLPDDEGINVCASLRKIEQYKTTTVLLVTPQKSSINYDFAFSNGVTQLIGRHELHRFSHAVELLIERNKPISGNVLLVEDSRSQAEYVSMLLQNMGLEVVVVCSAEQAMKEMRTTTFNLAIIDVVLAGNMTGVELVDYIRALPEPKNSLRVLAVSGYEDSSRRIKLFNLGVDDFMSKPIIREELIARVRGVLSQHYIVEAARENEGLSRSLSQLLDNSPDIIGRFDINGYLLFMNPRMETELGVRVENEIGKHYTKLGLADNILAIYEQAIADLLRNKQVSSYQYEGKNNIDFDIQFSPETVDGHLTSFICSARDITRLIELQKELLASKEAVELASEAKTRFLATMSHELRTSLNAISGFGQLISQKLQQPLNDNTDELKEYLKLIGENAAHLTTLIDDVLDLSRIEAGKLNLDMEWVDAARLIEGLKASFECTCAERNIQLSVTASGLGDPMIVIDRAKTLNILYNLIGNAIKFSHVGGAVTVEFSRANDQFGCVVSDSGIGIPKDGLARICSPFEQLDNPRTRHYSGTGLGLSIVQKLTGFMSGSIAINSVEGEGTDCILTLPLGDPQLLGVDKALEVANRSNLDEYNFAQQKILVVEDSLVNQQLMTASLRSWGLTVEVAENGIEGVEKCLSWQPDLVLMDMHMPKMDGLSATSKIRELLAFKSLPIFGFSAEVHKEYIQKAINCGINEYLTKPLDFSLLSKLLNQYFNAQSQNLQRNQNKPAKQGSGLTNYDSENVLMNEESVLDVEKGIIYAANNAGLFKKLLNTFIDQYELSASQLLQLYESEQIDDAMKLAHTMKGVCATLGMDSLSEVAKVMQFAFANNELGGIGQHIQRYEELLGKAINEAKAYCAK